jgi:tRNA dimethylallyltransferase
MKEKTCIVIVGPTAVGKTSLALDLARQYHTSIISADSRQCFIEMNIGVAKPSASALAEVKHFFINSHHVNEEVNAALFEELSLQWCDEIFRQKNVVVMVGGTGLYVKAFADGLDDVPPSSLEIRNDIIANFNSKGLSWLQKQIQDVDPEYFTKGEIHNPHRMMRALEVIRVSGRSIVTFQSRKKKERPFNILKIGLTLPRQQLYERINARVDDMINEGLVGEVQSLLPYKNLNALQTVGYKELLEYFDGAISLEKAIELIKQNTRHYAKRQLTWFRKDAAVRWFDAAETAACIAFVKGWLTDSIDLNQVNSN